MHWSRLLDLPLALGLVALQPFLGPDMAVQVLAFVWPLVLIVPLMALGGALAMALGGREALLGGLVLVALAVPVLFEFAPGRVDHHAIQMLLTLGLALASVRALDGQRIGAPVLAGLVAATALGVGTESLPVVAAGVLAFGLMWVSEARRGGQLAAFGLSFGLASAAHLALAQPVRPLVCAGVRHARGTLCGRGIGRGSGVRAIGHTAGARLGPSGAGCCLALRWVRCCLAA